MTLRFFGLFFIFVASLIWSKQKIEQELQRIYLQEGMLSLIDLIKRSVLCYRLPLKEIYRSFHHDTMCDEGFLRSLTNGSLLHAYMDHRESFGYDSFSDRMIIAFSEKLGRLPISEQVITCEELQRVLQQCLNEKKERYPKQKKIYMTLGITVGMLTVILLI